MLVAGRSATAKKSPPITTRHLLCLGLKLVVSLSVALCLASLPLLHRQYGAASSSSSTSFRVRSLDNLPVGPPKIAFLYIARRNLPLDFLWNSFFENADAENFSIYVHSAPGFEFDESTTRSHYFYGRQLRNSIQVVWGESTMIEAERLLLEAALEDPANQRFVLLSDSCVPLYNFSYVYNYVMGSPKSFVDSFLDGIEGRYNPIMSPKIPMIKWRKGSQWITLIRGHAEVIVDDKNVFPVFKKLCLRQPAIDARKGKLYMRIQRLQKQHDCVPDEHYVQTLLAMNELEGELERRTLTYTVWNQSANKMEDAGWHPVTFTYANSGPQRIKQIKDINHVYYATEYRTEWCQANSKPVPCFLFARKFSQGAAMRLLREGVVGEFDSSMMLKLTP